MTYWDYTELPECVENLSRWLDENDGTMTWENARDLSLVLDWVRENSPLLSDVERTKVDS